jgi:hypothetical protein
MGYSAVSNGVRVAYTTTVTGFSSLTRQVIDYTLEGKRCVCSFDISGTSNATGFTFTLPFIADPSVQIGLFTAIDRGFDNGSGVNAFIRSRAASSNICDVFKDASGTAWTASGSKGISGTFVYFIA